MKSRSILKQAINSSMELPWYISYTSEGLSDVKQKVVYSGTMHDAKKKFKRFNKNCIIKNICTI